MKIFFTTCLLFVFASTFIQAQTVFLETFDNISTPSGWTNTATTGSSWFFSTNAGYSVASILDHTGNNGNYAWIDYSGLNAGVILETPVINISTLTVPFLKFFFESHYSGTLTAWNIVYVEAWDGATWVNISTLQGNTPFGWDEYGFNLTPYIYGGTNVKIRFRGESGGAIDDYYNDLLLDDVEVLEAPPCPTPYNLSAANITPTTADFSWTENGIATNWQIEFGNQGFTQGTGTSVFTTNNNPHNQTGLTPNTTYDLYVRSVCSPGDTSSWFGPVSFATACIIAVAPWAERFNGTSTPNCWAESGSESWRYSTSADFAAGNAGDHSGNGGNYAWIDGSYPSGPSQISTLESPPIDISTLSTPLLSYWVFSHNIDDNTYNTLTVEVYDGAAWNLVNTINSDQGNGWANMISDLQNLTITGPIQVRFTVAENASGVPYYNDILIDDIEVKDAPNVSADTLLGLQNLYCNAAVTTQLVIRNKSNNHEIDVPWAVESDGVIIASGSIPTLAPNSSDTIPLLLGGIGPTGINATINAYTFLGADLTSSDDTVTAIVGMSYTGVNANVTAPVGCTGASNGVILSAAHSGIGVYSYQWDPNANNQTSSTATGLAAGTYTLTVTDSIGCSSVATLTLIDPPALTSSTSSSNLTCNNNNSGMAGITLSGGVPSYTYLWNTGQMTSQITGIAAGTYSVTATDAYGCEATSSFTLTEPTPVLANGIDNGDGSATVAPTGGSNPYTYQWGPNAANQTTPTATGLIDGGVYYVVVTDSAGCTDVFSLQAIVNVLNINTIATTTKIDLYPNPTSGNVFVDLNLTTPTNVQVNITSVTGQTIMTHNLGKILTNKVELATASLPIGVYMVEFNLGTNKVTKKLIVTE